MTTSRVSLVDQLTQVMGHDAVLSGKDAGEKYAVDWSAEARCEPLLVVRPSSTDEVAAVLRICNERAQKVVVQGGLTGLSGGSTPQPSELALSLEKLSGIEELDSDSMTMTVAAGTPLQKIQEAADAAGFTFPLDLGARGSCAIGGNVSTNAGGNQVIRYGMTRALVLGLEAVLADGTVISSLNKMLKNNAGYDLKQLFIGTEGTLGVVTKIVLKLFPKMTSRCSALLAISEFDHVVAMLKRSNASFMGTVSSFEVMWASYFDQVVRVERDGISPFSEAFEHYVLLEVEGSEQEQDQERFERVLFAAMEDGLIQDAVVAQSGKEADSFWALRDAVAELLPKMQPLANFDIGIPIGKMKSFLRITDERLRAAFPDLTLMVFGHLGDGNLHVVATTGRHADVKPIYGAVYEVLGDHEGSVTAEHGVGTLKIPYLHYSRTAEEIALMGLLKKTMDPKGILNSNRVIGGES